MTRVIALLMALCAAAVTVPAQAEDAAAGERLELVWSDLLPPGEAERIARLQQVQAIEFGFNHFGTDQMPQLQTFNVVEELDGQRVRIAGFVLPFDFFRLRSGFALPAGALRRRLRARAAAAAQPAHLCAGRRRRGGAGHVGAGVLRKA